MISPTSYQGGKQRIASKIIDVIKPEPGKVFADLCCGSGCISIELVKRGFNPEDIVMLDRGPWGLFWKEIGDGTFNLDAFWDVLGHLPRDPKNIAAYLKEFAVNRPEYIKVSHAFLILQAGRFGGKAVWHDGERFHHHGFRSYWTPTATSNRRSPVNPMMPMPDTLMERIVVIAKKMKGVKGVHGDISEFHSSAEYTVYVDPPYDGTTAYGYSFDLMSTVTGKPGRWFVSEGKPLSERAMLISGSKTRKKGGICGSRKFANEEWLSEFT